MNTQKNKEKHWVGSWLSSQQLVEKENMPPEPGLSNNTLRQCFRTTIGGEQIRMKLSNQYGKTAMIINSVHLAVSTGKSSINPDTDRVLTFAGKETLIIPAGEIAFSDTIEYNLPELTIMTITIYFSDTPTDLTGHPGSRTTSYLQKGNTVDSANMPSAVKTDHWYVIAGIDVLTEDFKKAVVTLGDSITDGRGSTTNENNRWPDNLAKRLHQNNATSHIAVLNQGIGGNAVLAGGLGPTALSRFHRDVLQENGVRYLIIFEGVNDIGGSNSTLETAENLINAYKLFITKSHEENIIVYGATITPFGDSQYFTDINEEIRQRVNKWIRTSGKFDAVIDFDAAVRNPESPDRLLSPYDCGDHLHLSPEGYKRLAEIIDLNLFVK